MIEEKTAKYSTGPYVVYRDGKLPGYYVFHEPSGKPVPVRTGPINMWYASPKHNYSMTVIRYLKDAKEFADLLDSMGILPSDRAANSEEIGRLGDALIALTESKEQVKR